MAVWLLTWNPKKFDHSFAEEAASVARGDTVFERWSCGNTKRCVVGDRVIMLRQGVEPRGVFASGTVTKGSAEGEHWDDAVGRVTRYVEFRFDTLVDPGTTGCVPIVALKNSVPTRVNWATQASGIEISGDSATVILKLLRDFSEDPGSAIWAAGAQKNEPLRLVRLSTLTSRQAVLDALAECDQLGRDEFLKKYGYRYSRLYTLRHEGKTYDSKAIVGVAYGRQHGVPLKAREFSGGEGTVVATLERLGFTVGDASHPAERLIIGKTYFRKDLVDQFGGQLQAGIWTPKEFKVVFIFSGESGEQFGYRDGWTDDGIFQYTGEGQVGDMTFTTGNSAIRDHRDKCKDLLLFTDLGKGAGVRYEGLFECASWDYTQGSDKNKAPRQLIVFNLIPVSTEASEAQAIAELISIPNSKSLEDLRQAAYEAATSSSAQVSKQNARTVWYQRSKRVKDYVLTRAAGVCEACGIPAPFSRKDGSAYLEPHHTTRLADDGPDHPRWVGAICPNCHRRIHSGIDGHSWNERLQQLLAKKEIDLT